MGPADWLGPSFTPNRSVLVTLLPEIAFLGGIVPPGGSIRVDAQRVKDLLGLWCERVVGEVLEAGDADADLLDGLRVRVDDVRHLWHHLRCKGHEP